MTCPAVACCAATLLLHAELFHAVGCCWRCSGMPFHVYVLSVPCQHSKICRGIAAVQCNMRSYLNACMCAAQGYTTGLHPSGSFRRRFPLGATVTPCAGMSCMQVAGDKFGWTDGLRRKPTGIKKPHTSISNCTMLTGPLQGTICTARSSSKPGGAKSMLVVRIARRNTVY